MNSFDVYLPDGRAVTAESAGKGQWVFFLWDGESGAQEALSRGQFTDLDSAMVFAEQVAEAIGQDCA